VWVFSSIPAGIEYISDMLTQKSSDVRFARVGEVYVLGRPEPQKIPAAGIALLNLTRRRDAGYPRTAPSEIRRQVQEQLGFSGQMVDLLGQTLLDPLNFVPFAEAGGMKVLGQVTGQPALTQAAAQAMRHGEGVLGTLRMYPEVLKATPLTRLPSGDYNVGWLARTVGGLTPEGAISGQGGGLAGKTVPNSWWANSTKRRPSVKPCRMADMLIDNGGQYDRVVTPGDPAMFDRLIDGMRGLPTEDLAGLATILDTPAMVTLKPLVADMDAKALKQDAARRLQWAA